MSLVLSRLPSPVSRPRPARRSGFTLIEMTVVLLIIAIVTHLAMRQLGSRMDDRKTAAANRQLEEVRDSVFSFDREGAPAGFLADMGRLVTATNGTLSELWQLPVGARPYAVIPATKENLVTGTPTELVHSNVFVATGWRGPYLRLPIGKSRLTDPWGNPMENPDAAGYSRISVLNRRWAGAVSHFGPTALTNDLHRQTVALAPAKWSTTRLFVSVVSRSNGSLTNVTYKWFGPQDGRITGDVAKDVPFGATATFSGLTPGMRVVWDSASGISRLVKIRPGDNQLEIEVP